MKYLAVVIGLFFYLSSIKVAYAQKPNLLHNPDFEDSGAKNWQKKATNPQKSLFESLGSQIGLVPEHLEVLDETNPDLVYFGSKSQKIKASKKLGLTQDSVIDSQVTNFAHVNVLVESGSVNLVIEDIRNGKEYASQTVRASPHWQSLDIPLYPKQTEANVRMKILAVEQSVFYVDNSVLHEVDFAPLPIPEEAADVHNPVLYYRGKPVNNPPPIGASHPRVLGEESPNTQSPLPKDTSWFEHITKTIIHFFGRLRSFITHPVLAQLPSPTPMPPVNGYFPVRFYVAVQVHNPGIDPIIGTHSAPHFAKYFGSTIDEFASVVNNRLSSLGLNKSFSPFVVLPFDQYIPSNCVYRAYASETKYVSVNLPEPLCENRKDVVEYISAALSHGYFGGWASWDAKMWSTDHYNTWGTGTTIAEPDRALLHEIGHEFGFWAHYTDIWAAINTVTNETYISPDDFTIMGRAYSPLFFSPHSKEMIARNEVKFLNFANNPYYNTPDTLTVLDSFGNPFTGRLTIYPGSCCAVPHQPSKVDPAVFYGPVTIVNGVFDYKAAGKPAIAQVKAEHFDGSPSGFTWLDSSRLQLQFWQGQPVKFAVPIVSDVPPPTPTPTPTLTPTPTVTPTPLPPSALPVIQLNPSSITGGPSIAASGRTDCCSPQFAIDNNVSTFWAGDPAQNIPGGKWELIYTHSRTIMKGGVVKVNYLSSYFPASAKLSVSNDGIIWTLNANVPNSGSEIPVNVDYTRFKLELSGGALTPPYITEIIVKGLTSGSTVTPTFSPTPTLPQQGQILLNPLSLTGGPSYPITGRTDCCTPNYAADNNLATFWAGDPAQNIPGGKWSLTYTHAKTIKSGAKIKVVYYVPYLPASAQLFASTDGVTWFSVGPVSTTGTELTVLSDFNRFRVDLFAPSATPPYIKEIILLGTEGPAITLPTATPRPPVNPSPTPTPTPTTGVRR